LNIRDSTWCKKNKIRRSVQLLHSPVLSYSKPIRESIQPDTSKFQTILHKLTDKLFCSEREGALTKNCLNLGLSLTCQLLIGPTQIKATLVAISLKYRRRTMQIQMDLRTNIFHLKSTIRSGPQKIIRQK
jgi:hypothetical protein